MAMNSVTMKSVAMKKVVLMAMGLGVVACAEKQPLSAEQQWHGYCVSVGNAARSITLDRQNGYEQQQAVEHAAKVEDATTRQFIAEIIETVYAMPEAELKAEPDAVRDRLKQQFTEKCLATPHETLPNYKQF